MLFLIVLVFQPAHLMGPGGLGHKPSSVKVDDDAGRRGLSLGL